MAWIPAQVQAQQVPLSTQEMEDLLYRNEAVIITETDPDQYPDPGSSGIDLNNASLENLEASGIFTPYQIHSLLKYREKYGPIFSIYELAVLPGFHPSKVFEIEPYVSLISTNAPVKKSHRKSMLMVNLEKSMPLGAAYLVDSASGAKPKYAGPPLKTAIRFKAYPWKKLSMALSYEKDAGELFLYGNRPQFLSGYLSYAGDRFVKQLVFGNYKLNQGLGLVNGSGFFHRIGDFRINQQSLSRIRPYASLSEAMYEQGLACKMRTKKFQALIWASYHKFSLSSSAFTSDSKTINWLEYQRSSGLYRSKNELETRDLAYRIHSGFQLLYKHQNLAVGLMYGSQWVGLSNKAMVLQKKNPDPSPQQKISMHGNWYKRKLQIFGELSASNFRSLAFLLGTKYHFNDYIQGSLLVHHYGAGYRGALPSSYGSGSHIRNEQGIAFHLHMEPGKFIIAKLSGELFHYPLPRYLCHVPSSGYRLDLSLQNPTSKNLQWRARLVNKFWQTSPADPASKIRLLQDNRTIRFDAQLLYIHHDQFRWQSRLVLSYYSQKQNSAPAYAALQQIRLSISKNFKSTAQFVLFHISNWENRIYLYEPGFYYSFNFPAYYGIGQKITLLFTLKPVNRFSVSVKVSGLRNHGNQKWETGIQLLLKL